MNTIAEKLRINNCQCHDGYISRGMVDPQCVSCDTKAERYEAADEIDRLTAQLDATQKVAIDRGNEIIEANNTIFSLRAAEKRSEELWYELRTKLVSAGCDPYMLMPEMVDDLIAKVKKK